MCIEIFTIFFNHLFLVILSAFHQFLQCGRYNCEYIVDIWNRYVSYFVCLFVYVCVCISECICLHVRTCVFILHVCVCEQYVSAVCVYVCEIHVCTVRLYVCELYVCAVCLYVFVCVCAIPYMFLCTRRHLE